MDIVRLRNMLERAGHPSTPPHEASTSVKMVRNILDAEGRSFSDLQLKGVPLSHIVASSASLREQLEIALDEIVELKSLNNQLEREKIKLKRELANSRERLLSKKKKIASLNADKFAWDGPDGIEGDVIRRFLSGMPPNSIAEVLGWEDGCDNIPNTNQILQHTWNSPPPAYMGVSIGNNSDELFWEEFWLLGFLVHGKSWWRRTKKSLEMLGSQKFGIGDLSALISPGRIEALRETARQSMQSGGSGNQMFQRQVLAALNNNPGGLTDTEIEEINGVFDKNSNLRSRRAELEKIGFVVAAEEKRQMIGQKKPHTVWKAIRSVADYDLEIRKISV